MRIEPIGHIESPYKTKFGVPRQPGICDAVISRFVHDVHCAGSPYIDMPNPGGWVHVIWSFSHNAGDAAKWSKTVRPPLLGGSERVGVFATRSSFRPNNIALSTVQVISAGRGYFDFAGGDMVDGSPVFGLLPYDPQIDAREDANHGWPSSVDWPTIEHVFIPDDVSGLLDRRVLAGIYQVLAQDPRPAYARTGQEQREFWTVYDRYVIWFKVSSRALTVTKVITANDDDLRYILKTGNMPNNINRQKV